MCNHQIDWDEIAHITSMAYNVFLHSSAGEAPLHLMFGCDPFMPTLFKLLLPKLRYMGDKHVESIEHHVRNLYDGSIKPENGKRQMPTPIRDPNKTNFKIGDMVSIRKPYPQGHF